VKHGGNAVGERRERRSGTRKNLLQSELPHLWALNSAVECHLHTSSLFNTFNNLTRLLGTAKYLIIRGSQDNNGSSNGGCEKVQRFGRA
jgi:hypothetical protein